jgi:glutamate/aspartate transport system substrate-binding protein
MKSRKLSRGYIVAATLLLGALNAQAASVTMDKMKSTGTVTMGVRESSIPMSYTTGDGRFDGYHVEVCRMILTDIKNKLGKNNYRS